ncbi:MAG: hypothetical protein K9I99_16170, partial [Melioribacteraceae bacterium]|nr:hypothetical protein [Melioribacteraceae bacterium]
HLYISLQSVQAFISPPIVAVFLFGVFWKMSSKRAALITLLLGGAIGLLRIIFSFMPIPVFLDFEIINSFIRINFLHFAILLFLFSSSIMIFVSIYDNKYHREKSKIGSQELKNLEYQLAVPKFYEDKKSLKDFSNKPYLTKQTTSTTL